jgi:hypothetical protein
MFIYSGEYYFIFDEQNKVMDMPEAKLTMEPWSYAASFQHYTMRKLHVAFTGSSNNKFLEVLNSAYHSCKYSLEPFSR